MNEQGNFMNTNLIALFPYYKPFSGSLLNEVLTPGCEFSLLFKLHLLPLSDLWLLFGHTYKFPNISNVQKIRRKHE